MNKDPAKDFGPIADDYVFFMNHATEALHDAQAHCRCLAPVLPAAGAVRWLDFGCSEGNFTTRLLELLDWPPQQLRLSLIEPVDARRREAVVQLARFTTEPIPAAAGLPEEPLDEYDVVLSNHVFYYVPELLGTLRRLTAALSAQGVLRAAIAGRDNVLIQIWATGFGLIGRDIPYYTAEDVQAALADLGVPFEQESVPYRIAFPDTEENRLRIIRFLLANHLTEIPLPPLLVLFDPYASGGAIEIETASDHFTVRGS
ncbi:MAG: methyltransferase domain-containing protein [Planctomycetota bacterium]|nr:MAG: methyltransferase domain-containing protein [Planctomycetota bacterium]